MNIYFKCKRCGTKFDEDTPKIRFESACVGCGIAPCHDCQTIIYGCPECGSENYEECDADYEE